MSASGPSGPLVFYSISCVAVSSRDVGILHGKMHVISGRVDRLALLVCDAKFKSWCNIDHARIQKLLSKGVNL